MHECDRKKATQSLQCFEVGVGHNVVPRGDPLTGMCLIAVPTGRFVAGRGRRAAWSARVSAALVALRLVEPHRRRQIGRGYEKHQMDWTARVDVQFAELSALVFLQRRESRRQPMWGQRIASRRWHACTERVICSGQPLYTMDARCLCGPTDVCAPISQQPHPALWFA